MRRAIFRGVSTIAEIESAIEQLPPEQWMEIRRWMDSRTQGVDARTGMGKGEDFERRLAASVGKATTGLSTDEIMRITRGED